MHDRLARRLGRAGPGSERGGWDGARPVGRCSHGRRRGLDRVLVRAARAVHSALVGMLLDQFVNFNFGCYGVVVMPGALSVFCVGVLRGWEGQSATRAQYQTRRPGLSTDRSQKSAESFGSCPFVGWVFGEKGGEQFVLLCGEGGPPEPTVTCDLVSHQPETDSIGRLASQTRLFRGPLTSSACQSSLVLVVELTLRLSWGAGRGPQSLAEPDQRQGWLERD